MTRSRRIAAPPKAVWDLLADFGALSSWAPNVDHSCLLEHGTGPGLLGASRRVQVGRNTLVEQIIDVEAPLRLEYRIEGLPRQLRRITNRWELRPAGQGHTDVTLTGSVEIGANPLARLAERVMSQLMAKQSDSMLDGLADRMEGTL